MVRHDIHDCIDKVEEAMNKADSLSEEEEIENPQSEFESIYLMLSDVVDWLGHIHDCLDECN